jgi:hypothetical protein
MREIIIIVLGDGRVANFSSCQSSCLCSSLPHVGPEIHFQQTYIHTYWLTLRHKGVHSQKRYQIVVVSSLTKCRREKQRNRFSP